MKFRNNSSGKFEEHPSFIGAEPHVPRRKEVPVDSHTKPLNERWDRIMKMLESDNTPNGYFVPFHFMDNVKKIIEQEIATERENVRHDLFDGIRKEIEKCKKEAEEDVQKYGIVAEPKLSAYKYVLILLTEEEKD